MRSKNPRPPGIKELATALDISIGTVDRALHNRPGVNSQTRERVLRMAGQLGYRPNIAARTLKLNRSLRIGVYLPREIASFFNPLREGIRAGAAAVHGLNVELDFRDYPHLGEGDIRRMKAGLSRNYDGILIAPGRPSMVETPIQHFTDRGVPVVCVASDAPRSKRLASIAVDGFVSGGIAAELLGRVIKVDASVATLTGDLSTLDHKEKLRGFAATLAATAPHLKLLPAIECHDRPKDAYEAAIKLLKQRSRPAGIYIGTANSLPVFQAMDTLRPRTRVEVIATDLFDELVPLIESGTVLATLHQRPFTQGKAAFETLFRYLLERTCSQTVTRFAPHIVLRSNLPLFLGRERDQSEKDGLEE